MPRALLRSENKSWMTCGIYSGGESSERGFLYWEVRLNQGITTAALMEKVEARSGSEVAKRVPSRLIELERDGFLKSEFSADLFK
jgi:hypothetical protein